MPRTVVPVALIPRYGTFAGNTTFTTDAIDVTGYEVAELVFWRGPVAAGVSINMRVDGSIDGASWGTLAQGDPGDSTEVVHAINLTMPLIRAAVVLSGSAFGTATAYLLGELVRRR